MRHVIVDHILSGQVMGEFVRQSEPVRRCGQNQQVLSG
jgi:hypothetical protein